MSAVNLNSNLERFGGKLFFGKWISNIFWELWSQDGGGGGDSTKEMSSQFPTIVKLLNPAASHSLFKNKLYNNKLLYVSKGMRESYFKLFNVQQIKTQYGLPLQSFQKIFSTSTTLKNIPN